MSDGKRANANKLLYWISGPRLPAINLVAALITCAILLARRDWVLDVRAFNRVLDIIARVSFVFFVLTFIARPLNAVFRSRATRWLQKNRRYFGLAFAAWFLQHLWLLPALALVSPVFTRFWMTGKLVFPGLTLLLAVCLALTSTNRAQRSLPGWKVLHWIGLQALWLWFLAVYLKLTRARGEPYQFIYVGLLISAQVLRIGVFARQLLEERKQSA